MTRRPFDQKYATAQIPREGPRAAPFDIEFDGSGEPFSFNFLLTEQGPFLSLIATIFVDNSENDHQVSLNASVINQTLKFPPGSQAYVPILNPNTSTITLQSDGVATVGVDLINVPLPAAVWNAGVPGPPPGGDLWELEDASGAWELEDGSGAWELET